jgi:hypothetical protein
MLELNFIGLAKQAQKSSNLHLCTINMNPQKKLQCSNQTPIPSCKGEIQLLIFFLLISFCTWIFMMDK